MRLPPARYLLQRIIFAGVTVLVLVSVVFVLVRLTRAALSTANGSCLRRWKKSTRCVSPRRAHSATIPALLKQLVNWRPRPVLSQQRLHRKRTHCRRITHQCNTRFAGHDLRSDQWRHDWHLCGLHPDSWTDRLLMALNNLNLATPTLITTAVGAAICRHVVLATRRRRRWSGCIFSYPRSPWPYLSAVPLRDCVAAAWWILCWPITCVLPEPRAWAGTNLSCVMYYRCRYCQYCPTSAPPARHCSPAQWWWNRSSLCPVLGATLSRAP